MANNQKPDLSSNELMDLFDETMKEIMEEGDTNAGKAKKTSAIEFWKEIFAESDPFSEVTTPVSKGKTKPRQETAKNFWSELEEETHKMGKCSDLNKNFREILQIAETERKKLEAKIMEDKIVPHKILTQTRKQKQFSSLNNDAKTATKQPSDIVHKKIKINQEAERKQIVKTKMRNRFQEQKAVINEWAVFVDEVLKKQEYESQQQKYEWDREPVNTEEEKHIQLVKCVEKDYQREQMELKNLDVVAETIAAEQIGADEVLEQIDTIIQKRRMLYSIYNKSKMLSKRRRESWANLFTIPEKSIPILKIDKCVQTDNYMVSTFTEKNIRDTSCQIQKYENGRTVFIFCNEDKMDNTTEIDTPTLQSGIAEKHSTTQSVKKTNKADTKKTNSDLLDKMIDINLSALNNNSKEKPDNIRRISNESNKMDIKKHSVIEDKILKSDDTIPQNIQKTMQKAEKEKKNINTKIDDTEALHKILTQIQEHTICTPIPYNQDTKGNQSDAANLIKRLQEQEAALNQWAVLIDDVQKKQDFVTQQKYEDSKKCNKDSSDKTTKSNKLTLNIDTKIDKTQNKSDNSKKKKKPKKTHSSLNNDAKEKSENNCTSKSTKMVSIKMDIKQKLNIIDEILKPDNGINQNIQEIRQIAEKEKKYLEAELIKNKSVPDKKLTQTHEHTAYTPIPFNLAAEERKQIDEENRIEKEVCDKKRTRMEEENVKTNDKMVNGKHVQLAKKDNQREQIEFKNSADVADKITTEIDTNEKKETLYINFNKRKLLAEKRMEARRSFLRYLPPIAEEPFNSNLNIFNNDEHEEKDRREQMEFKTLNFVDDKWEVKLINTEEVVKQIDTTMQLKLEEYKSWKKMQLEKQERIEAKRAIYRSASRKTNHIKIHKNGQNEMKDDKMQQAHIKQNDKEMKEYLYPTSEETLNSNLHSLQNDTYEESDDNIKKKRNRKKRTTEPKTMHLTTSSENSIENVMKNDNVQQEYVKQNESNNTRYLSSIPEEPLNSSLPSLNNDNYENKDDTTVKKRNQKKNKAKPKTTHLTTSSENSIENVMKNDNVQQEYVKQNESNNTRYLSSIPEEPLNSSLPSLNNDNYENKDDTTMKKRNQKKNKAKPKTMQLTTSSENSIENVMKNDNVQQEYVKQNESNNTRYLSSIPEEPLNSSLSSLNNDNYENKDDTTVKKRNQKKNKAKPKTTHLTTSSENSIENVMKNDNVQQEYVKQNESNNTRYLSSIPEEPLNSSLLSLNNDNYENKDDTTVKKRNQKKNKAKPKTTHLTTSSENSIENVMKNDNVQQEYVKQNESNNTRYLSSIPEDPLNSSLPSLNNDNYENKDDTIMKKRNQKKNKAKLKTMHLTSSSEDKSEKTLILNFPASHSNKVSTPNSMPRKIMDKAENKSALSSISTFTDNTAIKTQYFLNSQNDKKEVKVGNDLIEYLYKSEDNTAYLIPSPGNTSNKTLIVNFPKFEKKNLRKPENNFQQSKDARMAVVSCNKNSTSKTTEINQPITQTDQEENKTNNTQKHVKDIPSKTLNIHHSSLNNDSKEKPDNNMKNKENNPIQSLKRHEDGRIVLITYNRDSIGKTTESCMSTFQAEKKNISHTQYNTTENKSDNTQTMKYLPDEMMNTTKSSLNDATTETKPDNNMQQNEIKQNSSKNDTEENISNHNTKNKNKRRNRRKCKKDK